VYSIPPTLLDPTLRERILERQLGDAEVRVRELKTLLAYIVRDAGGELLVNEHVLAFPEYDLIIERRSDYTLRLAFTVPREGQP